MSRKATAMSTPTQSPVNSDSQSEDSTVTTPVTDSDNSSDVTPNESPDDNTPQVNLDPGNIDPNFYGVMRSQLENYINEHNALAEAIKNAGDRVALMDSLKENPAQTGDDSFVSLVTRRNELSDALEAAEKEIAEKSEPFIQNHLQRSGVEEKQNKADEVAKAAKATLSFFSAMGASVDGLPTLTNRSGRSNSTSGDGRGAGVKKYRNLDVYVDGQIADQKITVKNSDGTSTNVRRSNLTYGAAAANVPNDVFREAFVKAQGTDDAAKFQERVEFEVTGTDGKVHNIVVKKAPQE